MMYKKRFEDGGEIGDYVGQSGYENPEVGSSLFAGLDLNALGIDPNLFAEGLDLNTLLPDIIGDADVMNALKAQDPAAYAALLSAGGGGNLQTDYAVTDKNELVDTKGNNLDAIIKSSAGADTSVNDAETKKLGRQAGTDPEQDPSLKAKGVPVGDPNDPTGTKKLTDISGDKKGILGTDITATDAAKYAAMLAMAKLAYDDAQRAREEARGWSAPGGYSKQAVRSPGGGVSFKKSGKAMGGGIGSLDMAQGGRALPPRYLDGHSDGMADKVPAHIDNKRPAALSDGEFVIPADVVSHLGNGNSNAGAKRLYKMMDDIRAARTGNPKQGKQINPDKFMPR
jgi:hypothetical protein